MKNFDIWNSYKKQVEFKNRFQYSEGDVWMVSMGENIGVEESGKGEKYFRPVLVLRKFNKDFALCVPLSTTEEEGIYYYKFSFKGKISTALISQIKPVDAKRFEYRMGSVGSVSLSSIKTKIRNMIS